MIFFLISLSIASTIALEELDCYLPNKFIVDLTPESSLEIDNATLKISYARNTLKVFTFSNTDKVNFVINETDIEFEGRTTNGKSHQVIKRSIRSRALGIAVLKDSIKSSSLVKFQSLFPRNFDESAKFGHEIENEILRLAARCMDNKLSKQLGNLKSPDYASFEDPIVFGILSVDPQYQNSIPCEDPQSDSEVKNKSLAAQSTLNKIVDGTIIEAVEYLKRNPIRIGVPDINETHTLYSLGWFGTFKIRAFNGILTNFTTAVRTSDTILDRDGNKFSVTFGLGILDPTFKYDLKAKYGFEVQGKLSANLEDLAFEVKISIDYGQGPCNTNLESLLITDARHLDLDITELPLQFFFSPFVNKVKKEWQSDIKEKSKKLVEGFINPLFNYFDCAKYTPKNI